MTDDFNKDTGRIIPSTFYEGKPIDKYTSEEVNYFVTFKNLCDLNFHWFLSHEFFSFYFFFIFNLKAVKLIY